MNTPAQPFHLFPPILSFSSHFLNYLQKDPTTTHDDALQEPFHDKNVMLSE